ncbi:D-alanyl-D-alanine carboxypeptidase, partial [Candidatus Microgenomates bacterium]|nr:D-alanyl-D-alanine carboxypeptidase [Candidatus Microgenomates bacterium]
MQRFKKINNYWILRSWSFGVLLVFALLLPGQNYYETLQIENKLPLVKASALENYTPSKYPKNVEREIAPYVSSDSVVVIDLESSVIFYSKNPDQKRYIASITKLMTALVALEYYDPDTVLTVKRLVKGSGESEMGLAVGDKVSVQNLIYGLLVPSGNDAAYTLADNYPGGIENFIYSMNKKAEQLHMNNTHFENPSGLDDINHYSTAKDVSFLAIVALKNKFISQVVSTYGITLKDQTGNKVYTMKNVNQFLGYLYGADGVKTGFTDLAGQCLVASVSRNNHRVISVVLNSNDRFGDSARLLEWV